jgi:hypothetical protein
MERLTKDEGVRCTFTVLKAAVSKRERDEDNDERLEVLVSVFFQGR